MSGGVPVGGPGGGEKGGAARQFAQNHINSRDADIFSGTRYIW